MTRKPSIPALYPYSHLEKHMKRRIIMRRFSLLLSMLLCLMIAVSGCTGTQATPTNAPTEQTTTAPTTAPTPAETVAVNEDGVNPAGEYPIVDEKINLSAYFVDYSGWIDLTDKNEALKFYEEKTNIHLDIVFGDTKVMLASGDYPEMFFSAEMSNQDVINYSSQGLILPLNEYIEKYGLMLKKAQEEYCPTLFEDITAPDGNIYGVPNVGSEYHTYTQKAYINVQWLQEANLQIPTTTDEFENVLKAFKQRGDDIRPYTGAIKTNQGDCQYWLINPFIVCDFVNSFLYVADDGKLQLSAIQPEFKEGLKWAHKLYADGLIDPGAFTQSLEQLTQLGNDPDGPKMGVFTANHLQMGIDINNIELSKQYDVLPPLIGPSGKGYTNWWDKTRPAGAQWVMTDICSNPAAAFRYVDFWITPENFFMNWIGRPGVLYVDAKPGQMNMHGTQAQIYDQRYDKDFVNPHANDPLDAGRLVQKPQTPQYFWELAQAVNTNDIYDPNWWTYTGLRLGQMTQKYEAFKSSQNMANRISSLWLTNDQATVITQLRIAITNYIDEYMIRFITGDLDIESGWTDYVKGVEALQLDTFIKMVQKAYDN